MKKTILLIIATFIFWGYLYSQESDVSTSKTQNMIGVNIGMTTGAGFSFRHWHNNLGLQVTLLPIKPDENFDISTGLTFFYSLKQKKHSNVFLYMGHHYMSAGFAVIYEQTPLAHLLGSNFDYNYNIGIGAGAELGKNPVISVMGGYAAYDILGDYKLLPTVELGLHFKLKRNK